MTPPQRVAMICHNPMVGRMVLNALCDAGIRPWLICDTTLAGSLRRSRLVAGTLLALPDLMKYNQEIIEAINSRPFDVVMGTDTLGQAVLLDIQDQLHCDVFPMPDAETLAILNNKERFFALCQRLGLRAPKSLFFANKAQVSIQRIGMEIGFPAVIKPVDQWGSMGFRKLETEAEIRSKVLRVPYEFNGLTVQQYVGGRDAGIGLFAKNGHVIASETFIVIGGTGTEFVPIPELTTMAHTIIADTRYSGICNIDCRIDERDQVWLLECNPRCFMRINAMSICGNDLLGVGFGRAISEACGNYYPLRDLQTKQGWQRLLKGRWPLHRLLWALYQGVRDPLPAMVQRYGRDAIKLSW
jgi:predicted ATP-grasp superfamily ATP-dependent carboligase